MKRLSFIATLLLAAVSTLSAQQSARLGSRQSISPLPKELTKDGKSYMVLAEFNENNGKHEIGLYDSFGPSGIKLSVDIPIMENTSYYEKAVGGIVDSVYFDDVYGDVLDYDNTYSTKAHIQAFLDKLINGVSISLKSFTNLLGETAYYYDLQTLPDNLINPYEYFWNYDLYGEAYPVAFYTIDKQGYLLSHFVTYSTEDSSIIILNDEYQTDYSVTYSSKSDIEKMLSNHFSNINYNYHMNIPSGFEVKLIDYYPIYGQPSYYIDLPDTIISGYEYDFYWGYNKYGKKYPRILFAINGNGYLTVYNVNYRNETDYTNAIWVKDPDYYRYSEDKYFRANAASFMYMNVDQSYYPTANIAISQNLFNVDDNWEYLSFDYELVPRDTGWIFTDEDGIYRREINRSYSYKGIKIMNNAGRQLAYLPIPNEQGEVTRYIYVESVSVLNGLVDIITEEDYYKISDGYNDNYNYKSAQGIYVIDPTNTSVQSISRAPARMGVSPTVIEKGERLNIQVSESGIDDNITISSMSGQIMNSSNVREGQSVLVDTSVLPKGIYNVTLRGLGNPTENQRIIIK